MQTFTDLSDNNFFTLWEPSAPMKYFEGKDTGYLFVFKVYELKKEINDCLLSNRSCLNYYFSLDNDQIVELSDPVIEDDVFDSMKQDLIKTLNSSGSMIKIC
jgi:hypothetical protein